MGDLSVLSHVLRRRSAPLSALTHHPPPHSQPHHHCLCLSASLSPSYRSNAGPLFCPFNVAVKGGSTSGSSLLISLCSLLPPRHVAVSQVHLAAASR